jgi:hypothetical protein
LQKQLSAGLRAAQAWAAGPVKPGPQRDAHFFYERAAAILQEILAEVSVD